MMSRPATPSASSPHPASEVDVCIVGAGVAGACLAHRLRGQGVRVALVDAQVPCTPRFRVEKLGVDQFAFLQKFGLMDRLLAVATPIGRIEVGVRGRIVETEWNAEYGFHYHELVNALREGLEIVAGHVAEFGLSDENQQVRLHDGRRLTARLVVLAAGGSASLQEKLGIARHRISTPHSMSFGFTIQTASGRLPYDELTYHPEHFADRVDYLTIFPVPDGVRANLFTYHDVRSPVVRAMRDEPAAQMGRMFPRLPRLIGPYSVVSKVEAVPMDIWVSEPQGRSGLVLIGDAFQSACPATGSGCTKVLNDVDVLAALVPGWLATPGMAAAKTDALYAHPQKRAVDERSVHSAGYHRRYRTDGRLRMRVHRAKNDLLMHWRGLRQRWGLVPAGRSSPAGLSEKDPRWPASGPSPVRT